MLPTTEAIMKGTAFGNSQAAGYFMQVADEEKENREGGRERGKR